MKKATTQQQELRAAMKRLKRTKRELAESLGVSAPTLDAWLAPATALRHRTMPKSAKLLLAAVLADAKRRK